MTLVISTGDPNGIGPEISLKAAAKFTRESFLLTGDAVHLRRAAHELGLGDRCQGADAEPSEGTIGFLHSADWQPLSGETGATRAAGTAQLAALRDAFRLVREGRARGLVTAPVSKAAIQKTGIAFSGHTEWLAAQAGLGPADVTMLFLGPVLRVGLVTTHLPIADVPAAITPDRVRRTVLHLTQALKALGEETPRLVVAGLNPHAGESGNIGTEESRIEAALSSLKSPLLEGPVGAETAFRWAQQGKVSGVVAMFHDQATIASKLLDWSAAVNVTWGLPFVRTSVDHGVAYDLAGTGRADPGSLIAAIHCAQRLTSCGLASSGLG